MAALDSRAAHGVRFGAVYFAFASGYLLSYLYRSVTAVISPELTRELSLTAGELGLLTSAYFIAFAAMQIPAGMLLDRFGPRRIEPVLLAVAGAGALAFSFAQNTGELLVARALIGMGVSVCLMAPLKGIATWFPHDRQASFAAWIMVAGGIGALVATAPTEIALRYVDWRTLFVGLAVVTWAVALWIALRVPDMARAANAPGFAAQWAGVRSVFGHPRFWWIVPLGGFGMGAFMAVQGLWSVPWLMEVDGMSRAVAADHLLVMSVVMLGGYLGISLFSTQLARSGIHSRHLFVAGFGLNAVSFAAIVTGLPGTYVWWTLYGLGAVANILTFPVLNEGFPRELAGRTNTAVNLIMFTGSFAAQWGIGAIVDVARATLALDTATGLRLAFGLLLALYVLAFAWFLAGWRRHAPLVRAVPV